MISSCSIPSRRRPQYALPLLRPLGHCARRSHANEGVGHFIVSCSSASFAMSAAVSSLVSVSSRPNPLSIPALLRVWYNFLSRVCEAARRGERNLICRIAWSIPPMAIPVPCAHSHINIVVATNRRPLQRKRAMVSYASYATANIVAARLLPSLSDTFSTVDAMLKRLRLLFGQQGILSVRRSAVLV